MSKTSLDARLAVEFPFFYHVTEATRAKSMADSGLSLKAAAANSTDESQYSRYQVGNRRCHCICTQQHLKDIAGMVARDRAQQFQPPVPIVIYRIPVASVLSREYDLDRSHGFVSGGIAAAGEDPTKPVSDDLFINLLRRYGCLALFEDIPFAELEVVI